MQDAKPNIIPRSISVKTIFIVFIIVGCIGFSVSGSITFKIMNDQMDNPTFLSTLSLLMYIAFFGTMFLINYFIIGDVTREDLGKCNWKYLFYSACLQEIVHIILFLSSPKLPGPVFTLLTAGGVIFQFIFSKTLLGKRYGWGNYMAAVLVTAGLVTELVFPFLTTSAKLSDGKAFYKLLMVGYCVVQALNQCLYEVTLQGKCNSVAWFNLVIALFCLPMNCIFVWLALGHGSIFKTSQQMMDGFRCFFLEENALVTDTCHSAWMFILISTLIAQFGSLFNLLVVKHLDAATMVICGCISLPITNLAFSAKWLLGSEAAPVHMIDIVCLIVICAGLSFWCYEEVKSRNKEEKKPDTTDFTLLKNNEDTEHLLAYDKYDANIN